MWSCRVHVGQHGMRTRSSAWWLPGIRHKDPMKLQFYIRAVYSVSIMCVSVTSTWLLILMGGPLGPPAKRGDMKDYDRKNIAP